MCIRYKTFYRLKLSFAKNFHAPTIKDNIVPQFLSWKHEKKNVFAVKIICITRVICIKSCHTVEP